MSQVTTHVARIEREGTQWLGFVDELNVSTWASDLDDLAANLAEAVELATESTIFDLLADLPDSSFRIMSTPIGVAWRHTPKS